MTTAGNIGLADQSSTIEPALSTSFVTVSSVSVTGRSVGACLDGILLLAFPLAFLLALFQREFA